MVVATSLDDDSTINIRRDNDFVRYGVLFRRLGRWRLVISIEGGTGVSLVYVSRFLIIDALWGFDSQYLRFSNLSLPSHWYGADGFSIHMQLRVTFSEAFVSADVC